ncbi:MAG: hypothetical protein ACYTEV_00070 [Planctomycetota bacterium]
MRRTRHGMLRRRSPLRGAAIAAAAATVWCIATSGSAAAPPAAEFRFADAAAAETRTLSGAAAEGHLTLEFAAVPEGASGGESEGESEGMTVGYQLQRSLDPGFLDAVIHHDGPSDRVFVSGLPEGTHHFRVRARAAASADDPEAWGPWSDAATFEVRHQSMGLTWTLFGSGAALFVVLVLIIGRESARDASNPGAGRA